MSGMMCRKEHREKYLKKAPPSLNRYLPAVERGYLIHVNSPAS